MNELNRDELKSIIWFLRNRLWNLCAQKYPQDFLSDEIQKLVNKIDDNDFSDVLN